MQIEPFSFREFSGESVAGARSSREFLPHGRKKEEAAPLPPPPPIFSEAELRSAERDGYQKGFLDGVTEGKTQAQIHFALGRAFEQREQYPQAFRHYETGNSLRRRETPFDAAAFEQKCRRVAATFSAQFLRSPIDAG